MSSILHFRKQLLAPPDAVDVAGIVVRSLAAPAEVPQWLALRERAMAGQIPASRPWTRADFEREMIAKSWWRSDWSWVAVPHAVQGGQPLAGAVTLAMRAGDAKAVPVVHWLIVDPAYRRRGVGRLLMAHLERAAWDAGWREVELETHAGWEAAVQFYHSIGYAPVRERSPR
jgi:GNAT superfamily N-acetyltransferase